MKSLISTTCAIVASFSSMLMLPTPADARVTIWLQNGEMSFRNDGNPKLRMCRDIEKCITLQTGEEFRYPLGEDKPVNSFHSRKLTIKEHKYYMSVCEDKNFYCY